MDLFDAKNAALITQLQRQQVAYLLVGGYIHRNDLVLNKRSSGREKDLADVRSLQFIETYWNGQKLEVYEKPTPQSPAPGAADEQEAAAD